MYLVDRLEDLLGRELYSCDGERLGRVGQIFLDDETNRLEWVTVRVGLFSLKESFIPVVHLEPRDAHSFQVSLDRDTVRRSPHVLVKDGRLSHDEENRLYTYYGFTAQADEAVAEAAELAVEEPAPVRSMAEPVVAAVEPQPTAAAIRRSQAPRVRVRKYLVTEEVWAEDGEPSGSARDERHQRDRADWGRLERRSTGRFRQVTARTHREPAPEARPAPEWIRGASGAREVRDIRAAEMETEPVQRVRVTRERVR